MEFGGAVRCFIGASDHVEGGFVPSDVWAHVACRYDGHEAKLYIDGALKAGAVIDRGIPSGTEALHLAEASPDGNDQIEGTIDTVRIWNRALTAQQLCVAAGKCSATVP
jgi:hypothetical protein